MKYASICTGIGGLDLAIEAVFGATPAWFCEYAPMPRQVLERHWPGVPIYEDVKATDWSSAERVELICAGYPCQPFSHAGKRAGTDDPRHLWPYIADALRVLRPRLVVLENVAGHVDLGLDVVLGDLAEMGFDAEWGVVRASDVGACHQRARIFVLAAHPERGGRAGRWPEEPAAEGRGDEAGLGRTQGAGQDAPDTDRGRREVGCERYGDTPRGPADGRSCGHDADRLGAAPAHADDSTEHRERARPEPREGDQDPADAEDVGRERGGQHGDGGPDLRTVVADTHGPARHAERGAGEAVPEPRPVERPGRCDRVDHDAWGEYGPAIERHARVLGRPAPPPTDERGRLAVPFVEWMQMLPEGWVDGLKRTAALTALGNVVVPAQAEHALKELMSRA